MRTWLAVNKNSKDRTHQIFYVTEYSANRSVSKSYRVVAIIDINKIKTIIRVKCTFVSFIEYAVFDILSSMKILQSLLLS